MGRTSFILPMPMFVADTDTQEQDDEYVVVYKKNEKLCLKSR